MAVLLEKRNLCGLVIDAVVSEGLSKNAFISDETISSKGIVSDHMHSGPTEITLRAIFSALPPKDIFNPERRPRESSFEGMPIRDTISTEGRVEVTDIEGSFDSLNSSEQARISRLALASNPNNPPSVLEFYESYLKEQNSEVISETSNNQNELAGISHFGSKASSFSLDADATVLNGRVSAAWCRLNELMDNKEVCQLVTGLKVYDDVVVTSIRTQNNPSYEDKLDVEITLREIKFVEAQTARISRIATGKGTVERGKITPDCLRLNEVFNPNDSNSGAVITRITNSQTGLQTVNFDNSVWNNICGNLGSRYINLFGKTIRSTCESGRASYALACFDRSNVRTRGSILIDEEETTSPPEEVQDIQRNCQNLLSESAYAGLCDLPKRCGDTRSPKVEDSQNDNSTGLDTSTDSLDIETAERLVNQVTQNELLAEDPASQFYNQSLSLGSLIDDFGINNDDVVLTSKGAQQIQRLNCYYCEMLNSLIRSSPNLIGERLRRVRALEIENENCQSNSLFDLSKVANSQFNVFLGSSGF